MAEYFYSDAEGCSETEDHDFHYGAAHTETENDFVEDDCETAMDGNSYEVTEGPAPKMPDNFYSTFDNFLSRPAPAFAGGKTKSGKGDSGKLRAAEREGRRKSEQAEPRSFLPNINSGTNASKTKQSGLAERREQTRKSTLAFNPAPRNPDSSGPAKEFDTALLQEAFRYTELLMTQQDEKEDVQKVNESTIANNKRGNMRKLRVGNGSCRPHDEKPALSISSSSKAGKTCTQSHNAQTVPFRGTNKIMSAAQYIASMDDGNIRNGVRRELSGSSGNSSSVKRGSASSKAGKTPDGSQSGRNPYESGPSGRSGPSGSSGSSGSSGMRRKNGSVKKLRAKTNMAIDFNGRSDKGDFTVSAVGEVDRHRNVVDYDSLVKNFEQGITMQRLKTDLQQSQSVIAHSEAFFKQVSEEFFKSS
jgi:hypothetical protein